MENTDMRKLCEQQAELSKMYSDQQRAREKILRDRYKLFTCSICNKKKYMNGSYECDGTGRCCKECIFKINVPAILRDMWLKS